MYTAVSGSSFWISLAWPMAYVQHTSEQCRFPLTLSLDPTHWMKLTVLSGFPSDGRFSPPPLSRPSTMSCSSSTVVMTFGCPYLSSGILFGSKVFVPVATMMVPTSNSFTPSLVLTFTCLFPNPPVMSSISESSMISMFLFWVTSSILGVNTHSLQYCMQQMPQLCVGNVMLSLYARPPR